LRLTRTRLTDETDGLASADRETQVVNRRVLTVSNIQVFDLQ
jgi:hypothetical protein